MEFTKMQGAGNDFIVFRENMFNGIYMRDTALKLCDRHFGIGADGLILVCESDKYDAKMRVFNSDGSEAEMCGNGIRCFSKYAYDRGIVDKKKMNIETSAGLIRPEVFLDNVGKVVKVKVDIGKPSLQRKNIPVKGDGTFIREPLTILGKTFLISAVNTGVPHAVIFLDDIKNFDITYYGPAIEKNEIFTAGINVDFVQVLGKNNLKMKTWERGAGLTLACGSGACAAAYISYITGYTERKVDINLPGGDLYIEIEDSIYMTGPCKEVYSGNISY